MPESVPVITTERHQTTWTQTFADGSVTTVIVASDGDVLRTRQFTNEDGGNVETVIRSDRTSVETTTNTDGSVNVLTRFPDGQSQFETSKTGVKGAQGGVMMFGMMGSFLPATAATLIASNPVLLGAGALFGGMQLLEDRKRRVTMRRQTARQQVRTFVDDVQFEVTDQLTALIRDVQRSLRDEFTERLTELQRTYTETAQRAQESAKSTQEQQQKRAGELKQQLELLGKIEAVANSVSGS
ncbi:MAG: hypothetical protein SGJ13_07780 [Actinomycetota bacterium]|nr:hypothetical protein [Actinomycetota bacterium]